MATPLQQPLSPSMGAVAATEPQASTKSTQFINAPPSLVPRQRELLDLIGKAKEIGFDANIDMPEIAVFGDQSSGKSSVLEAITQVGFLIDDGLCTRFAIEFVMRYTPDEHSWSAKIIPDTRRSEEEKAQLRRFAAPDVEIEQLGVITRAASTAMGLDTGLGRNFSHDVLRVTICGPQVPNLTLVDLPGIFHGKGPGQSEEDAEQVEKLVKSYMHKPRTLILAIIAADRDLASQVVTKWAQQADPSGSRTMGVITKPDMLDESPSRAKGYIDIATHNNVVHCGLGWHVLKNKKFSEGKLSLPQRDQIEKNFLATGLWSQLPESQKGIAELMKRLSKLLGQHILSESVPLITAFEEAITKLDSRLAELTPVAMVGNLKAELRDLSLNFTQLVTHATTGSYTHPFFRTQALKGQRHLELRRVVEELITKYVQTMHDSGHSYQIIEDDISNGKSQQFTQTDVVLNSSRQIRRSEFMSHIAQRLEMVPHVAGQFDFGLASDLFHDLSQPWADMTKGLTEAILHAVNRCLEDVLRSLAPSETIAQAVWDHLLKPKLSEVARELGSVVEREMQNYSNARAVMFDRKITDQIPQAQREELRRVIGARVQTMLQPGGFLQREFTQQRSIVSTTRSDGIVEALVHAFPLERLTYAGTIHCVQTHYQVSLTKIIGKFDLSSFDDWLLLELPNIFTHTTIQSLSEEQLGHIGSGTVKVSVERNRLQDQRDRLAEIWDALSRIVGSNGKHDGGDLKQDTPRKRKRSA